MSVLTKLHYGYIIVLCCCLIMGINIRLVMSCAGIFYKPVSAELGVSVGDLITPLLALLLRNYPADKGLKAFVNKNRISKIPQFIVSSTKN